MVTLYAGLDDRVLVVRGERRSHCAGNTQWDVTERLSGANIDCVDASPDRPERVFVGTVDGLRRSEDGGETFEAVGGFSDRVTAVTVSPHDPDVVWVGTEPSAVYRSADGGRSWEERGDLTDLPSAERWSFPPRPDTHHVRWLAVNPHDPAHIYVAIEAGAFIRSVDGGQTWQPHPEGGRRDNHTIATHPDDPCRVYVAAGDGYAESPDCGDNWTYPDAGLDHGYVWGLAVDRDDPDRVVVSAASGARRAHSAATADSYVYRKTGDSDRWARAMEGLPEPEGTTRAVLAAGSGAGEFVALTNRGIYRSHDGAARWHELDIPWPERYTDQAGRGLAVVP
ncbi:WD40/YVTN/BNR-like repeat-containing protein [Halovenus marina]|uniref:WD40/YVTN/BNR-like repeat-containing protein n=1 Tax=Halovenus marina TaxID=3396621 RepID=UPI003F54E664